MPKQFSFCRVCGRNHDQGKGHKYGVKHTERRDQFLLNASGKIQEVLYFMKNVTRLREQDRPLNRFWCHFCEEEITEATSSFCCANVIRHLASRKHLRGVKSFWMEHGGEFEQQRLYCVAVADYEKWLAACDAAAPTGQEISSGLFMEHPSLSEQAGGQVPVAAVGITDQGEHLLNKQAPNSINNLVDSGTKPQMCSSNSAGGSTNRPLQFAMSSGVDDDQQNLQRRGTLSTETRFQQKLTAIPMPALPGLGNVHTGAPPPWLKVADHSACSTDESGLKVLSRSQERKLAKLRNPKRVGAAWAERRRAELENELGQGKSGNIQSDASWLPKFGRVWQSGSRMDTRREFEAEKAGVKRKISSVSVSGSTPIQVKAYVSKRQRQVQGPHSDI